MYVELTPAGFSPSQVAVAHGERVAFVVQNRRGQPCPVQLGSWAGPAVKAGATATATVGIAGQGQLTLGCAGDALAPVIVSVR